MPAVVIDQRFGRGVVLQEAINEAIQPAYEAAMVEAKAVPLAQPEIEITKLEDGELVEFTAEVDIRPEFDLPDFAAIETTVDALPSLDDEVEERIALLRKRFATTTELDRETVLISDLYDFNPEQMLRRMGQFQPQGVTMASKIGRASCRERV